jgi:hypothetical protein
VGSIRNKILRHLGSPKPTLSVPYYKMVDVLQAWTMKEIQTAYQMFLHLNRGDMTFDNVGQYLKDTQNGAYRSSISKILEIAKENLASEREMRKALKRRPSKAQRKRLENRS